MKEKEKRANSTELTTKPVHSTLEIRGDVFMPEPGQGEIPPIDHKAESEPNPSPRSRGFLEKATTDSQRQARELLLGLEPPTKNASVGEKRSYEIVKGELMERAGIASIAGASIFEGLNQSQQETLGAMGDGWRGDEDALETISRRLGITPDELKNFRGKKISSGPDIYEFDVEGIVGAIKSKGEAQSEDSSEEKPRETSSAAGGGDVPPEIPGVDENDDSEEEEPDEDSNKGIQRKIKRELDRLDQRIKSGEIFDEEDKRKEVIRIMGMRGTPEEQLQRDISEGATSIPYEARLSAEVGLLSEVKDADVAKALYKRFIRNVRVALDPIRKGDVMVDDKRLDSYRVLQEELDKFNDDELISVSDFQVSAQRILRDGDLADFTARAAELNRERYKKSEDSYPKSLDHLVILIMASEGEEWGVGGEQELRNEKGELQMHNLLAWIREQTDNVQEFNPDSPVNFFGEIYIPTLYRQITIGEIIQQIRYFRKEEDGIFTKDPDYLKLRDALLYEVWFKMKSHTYDTEYRQVMGQQDEAIKSLIKSYYEGIFTKDKTRFYNILTLPSVSAGDGQEAMTAIKGEKRTSAGTGQAIRKILLAHYYLSEIGVTEEELGRNPDGSKNENMFEKILENEDSEGTVKFYKGILGKIISDKFREDLWFMKDGKRVNLIDLVRARNAKITRHNIKNPDNKLERVDLIDELLASEDVDFRTILQNKYGHEHDDELLGKNGSQGAIGEYKTASKDDKKEAIKRLTELMLGKTFILNKEDPDKGLNQLNIYGRFGRRAEIGELVKAGLKRVFQEDENLSDGDIRYAYNFAFSMPYWTLISAKNDTGAIGFDAASKMINFSDYRLRQMGKGLSGDIENMYGIRRLMLNMWEGLRVTEDATGRDMSFIELLQGGRGDSVNTRSAISEFEFTEGNAQRQFAVNHLISAQSIYQNIMSEHGVNFGKILTRDKNGRLIVDPVEADKFRSGLWKALRYGLDFGQFHFDRDERSWWREEVGEEGSKKRVLRFGTRRLGNLMFNKELLHMNMYRLEDDRVGRSGEYLFKDAYRDKVDEDGTVPLGRNGKPIRVLKHEARNVLAYLVSKDLWKHVRFDSTYEQYTPDDIEQIKDFFDTFYMELEETETGDVKGHNGLFNAKDWKTIARASGTTPKDLRLRRAFYVGEGATEGALKGVKTFVESLAA